MICVSSTGEGRKCVRDDVYVNLAAWISVRKERRKSLHLKPPEVRGEIPNYAELLSLIVHSEKDEMMKPLLLFRAS